MKERATMPANTTKATVAVAIMLLSIELNCLIVTERFTVVFILYPPLTNLLGRTARLPCSNYRMN